MKEIIGNWIINVTMFSLISTFLVKMLPGKTYVPFVRLFSGFILILLFLDPLLSQTGLDLRMEKKIEEQMKVVEQEEMENKLIQAEEKQKERYEKIYEEYADKDTMENENQNKNTEIESQKAEHEDTKKAGSKKEEGK